MPLIKLPKPVIDPHRNGKKERKKGKTMVTRFRHKNQTVNVRPAGSGGTPLFRQRLFFYPRFYSYPFYLDPGFGMIVPCIEVAAGQGVPSSAVVSCTPSHDGTTTCCAQSPYGWAQRCPPGTAPVLPHPVVDVWGRRWYLCTSAYTQAFTPFFRPGFVQPISPLAVVRTGGFRRSGRRFRRR